MTGAIRAALDSALGETTLSRSDGAAVALARRYADDLDAAEVVNIQAVRWLREVAECLDPEQFDKGEALIRRMEQSIVLASLGPKFLTALTELGMTPKARAAVAGGRNDPVPADPLAEFRAERAARAGSA